MSFSTITLRPTTAKASPPHSRPAPPYYGCAAAIPTACWWQPSSSRTPAGAMCTSTAARPYPRSAPAEPQICLKSPAMPSPLSDRGSGGKLATQHQAEAEQRRTQKDQTGRFGYRRRSWKELSADFPAWEVDSVDVKIGLSVLDARD